MAVPEFSEGVPEGTLSAADRNRINHLSQYGRFAHRGNGSLTELPAQLPKQENLLDTLRRQYKTKGHANPQADPIEKRIHQIFNNELHDSEIVFE